MLPSLQIVFHLLDVGIFTIDQPGRQHLNLWVSVTVLPLIFDPLYHAPRVSLYHHGCHSGICVIMEQDASAYHIGHDLGGL